MRAIVTSAAVCLLLWACREPSIVVAHSEVSRLEVAEIRPEEGARLDRATTIRARVEYSLNDDADRDKGSEVAGYHITLYFSGAADTHYVSFGEPHQIQMSDDSGSVEFFFPVKDILDTGDLRRPPACFFALEKVLVGEERNPTYRIVARTEELEYR